MKYVLILNINDGLNIELDVLVDLELVGFSSDLLSDSHISLNFRVGIDI
jgi:hypothetical protein